MLFYFLLLIYIFQYTGLHKSGPLEGLHIVRILVLITLICALAQKPFDLKHRFTKILISFVPIMILTMPFSYLKSASFEGLIAYIKVIIVAYLTIVLIENKKQLKIFISVYLIINFYASIGSIQEFFAGGAGNEMHRLGASGLAGDDFLGDPNDFALAMNVILPYAYFYFLGSNNIKKKLFYSGLACFYILGIIVSYSRGGFLTLVVAFITCAILSKKYLASSLIGIVLITGFVFLAPQTYKDRLSSITKMSKQDTGYGRLQLTLAGLKMMRDRPLTGVGLNAFPSAYGKDYLKQVEHYSAKWRVAHNSYITIGAELGIIALVLYIYLIIYIVKDNHSFQKKLSNAGQESSNYYITSKALTASIISYSIGSYFLTACYYPHIYLIGALTILNNKMACESMDEDGAD